MDNNQNPNVSSNEMNTASDGVVSPAVTPNTPQNNIEQVSFNIGGVEVSTPTVQTVEPTPMPAQNVAPIAPTPMPAQNVTSVGPTQMSESQVVVQPTVESTPVINSNITSMPTQNVAPIASTPVSTPVVSAEVTPSVTQSVSNEAVTPTVEDSPFFTPESVQPTVETPAVLPTSTPVPEVTQETVVSQQPVEQEDPTPNNQSEVEVIQTAPKNKASNAVLFIILILLIVFVINIDTVISMYEQYTSTKTISNPTNKNTDNLIDGFILINENTSSIKISNIKFYNFKKSQGKGITFSYEALAKYDDVKTLGIYIEIYNSEKEIIYKELFDPNQKVEKDTVRIYTMDVEDYVYNNAFYALVKIYTDIETKLTSTLTCTIDDENKSFKNTYYFTNNGLTSYDVSKVIKDENNNSLENEYNELKDINTTAIFENNTLTYKVDLNAVNSEFIPLYDSDTTIKVIKDKETLKEWKCE